MDIDIGGFLSGLESLSDNVLKAAERGGGKAGTKLLNDATIEEPITPVDEGTLRGSGSVFVNNELTTTTPNRGGNPTPATVGDDKLDDAAISVSVGFNTPYAAYQHEGQRDDGTHQVENYTEPTSGAKFLEKPLIENKDDYIKIVQAEIKGAIG